MRRRLWKPVASLTIIAATVAAFIEYFLRHPDVRHQLGHIRPGLLALLLILYLGTIIALTFNTYATLRLCRLRLPAGETFLITAYTAVINFFGPLQSGPAFRAVYLKKRHDLNLKDYAVASLFYLFFYGLFSGLFLLSGLLKWWLLPLVGVAVAASLLARRQSFIATKLAKLDVGGWYVLALAALAQVLLISLLYFAELRSVAPQTTFSQAVVYTGAANLALYVSITPAAIGFRESFLLFSQRLHHVPAHTIVAANILDRAVYVLFLLILAAFIFGTHATRRLRA